MIVLLTLAINLDYSISKTKCTGAEWNLQAMGKGIITWCTGDHC